LKNLSIIGGGSWGTALALVLAPRFPSLKLWVYEQDLAERMCQTRTNDVYLPGFSLPRHVEVTSDLADALKNAEIVLSVVPSHLLRGLYQRMRPYLCSSMTFVSATKGLENGSLLRMSQVIREVLDGWTPSVAVISGPSFAKEVARMEPTALVAASDDRAVASEVQSAFSGPTFRVYTSSDPTGVEIGGSIKNVVAIGAGVLHGLGLGHNAMAALITRGLAEMTRLAAAMGGKSQTLAGLAGLGDLVLTCTGELSRNRTVGVELAHGRRLEEITGSMKMVAEGVKTTNAAVDLARRYAVEMPIAEQMFQVLHEGTSPREAIQRLMERSLKGE
jgi:glycerol-3-phosphate dehydrogenase (NAD(P)+)